MANLTGLEQIAKVQVLNLTIGHLSLWIVGLAGLGLGNRQLSRRILEREQAELSMRETEARSRIILSSAMDAVINIDEQSRICDWSGQAEMIFGWSREEAMGQPIASLIVPERYREAHYRGMQTFLSTDDGKPFSKRIEINAMHRG